MLAGVHRGVLIEILESRNAALEALVTDLMERLAKVERAVSRNSGKSSMPPSADDLPGRTAPETKPGRGNGKKKQGKQPPRDPNQYRAAGGRYTGMCQRSAAAS